MTPSSLVLRILLQVRNKNTTHTALEISHFVACSVQLV